MLASSLIPTKGSVLPLPMRIAAALARLFCLLFNVNIVGSDIDRIRAHRGLIFPNHLSYLDSILLVALGPVRFLSAAEVKRYPIIGWLAQCMGTVFVERSNRNSRQQARMAVADALRTQPRPAIVIYPEGRLGIGTALFAFRHGAFEIAVENDIPFLTCAIRYEPADIALWRGVEGETLLPAIWRLAHFPGPVQATVLPMSVVSPSKQDQPSMLAVMAQAEIATSLSVPALLESTATDGSAAQLPAPAWQQPRMP